VHTIFKIRTQKEKHSMQTMKNLQAEKAMPAMTLREILQQIGFLAKPRAFLSILEAKIGRRRINVLYELVKA
jgi:hypothetical protein